MCKHSLVPPFPSIQPQIEFCWLVALAFNSPWKIPAVVVGRLSQGRAELCSVAQVRVGANSNVFEVSNAQIRRTALHREHRESIVRKYLKFFDLQESFGQDLLWCQ
jgi:hypothetical protein